MINNVVDFDYMKKLEANIEFFCQSNFELKYFSKNSFQKNFTEIKNRHNVIVQISQQILKTNKCHINYSTCPNISLNDSLHFKNHNICIFPQNIQNNIQFVNTIQNININNNFTNNFSCGNTDKAPNFTNQTIDNINEGLYDKVINKKRGRNNNNSENISFFPSFSNKSVNRIKSEKNFRQIKENSKGKKDCANNKKNDIVNKFNFTDSEYRLVNYVNMPIKRKRIKKIDQQKDDNVIVISREEISRYIDIHKLNFKIKLKKDNQIEFMKRNFPNFLNYPEIVKWRENIEEYVVKIKFGQLENEKNSQISIKKMWEIDKLGNELVGQYLNSVKSYWHSIEPDLKYSEELALEILMKYNYSIETAKNMINNNNIDVIIASFKL